MRRIIILLLLFIGMQLILPLGQRANGGQTLLNFGFLILAAYTVGEIAQSIRLPKIVGYLLAGVLFGPDVLGIVSPRDVNDLGPVSQLAIALIAFLAGAELRWSEVRGQWSTIMSMLGAEAMLAFLAIFGLLLAMRPLVPFLQDTSAVQAVALATLFASVAIVHSPAVTLALLTETNARGPVARTTLGVVLVADVVVVLLFSAALSVARTIVPPTGTVAPTSIAMLSWEIGGSIIVGALLGGVVALYLRFVQRELLIFAILVAFLGAEIARLAHVETLLTLLTAGFVTENVSRRKEGEELRHAMERSSAPVFVVFFALAGAHIALADIRALWFLIIPLVLVRILAIRAGTMLGARWIGAGEPERRYVWMGLISQAGVAIGLAAVIAEVYPGPGESMATLFLAMIAVNETLGPIFFRQALVRSGEAVEEPDEGPLRRAPSEA